MIKSKLDNTHKRKLAHIVQMGIQAIEDFYSEDRDLTIDDTMADFKEAVEDYLGKPVETFVQQEEEARKKWQEQRTTE